MAFYDFQCGECGAVFTLQQSFEEHDRHADAKCPQCGSTHVEQLIGSVNVITSKKS